MKIRKAKVLKANIILLLILIIYYFINKITGLYIPCIFHEITGLKCPGCGITHLIFNLLNFKIADAFHDNPLVFIYLPFIAVYYFYMIYLYIYGKRDKILIKIPNFVWGIIIGITIAFGILRNIY